MVRFARWTWVPLKEIREFEREVKIEEEDESQIVRGIRERVESFVEKKK